MDASSLKQVAEWIGLAIELGGAAVIVAGLVWALARSLFQPPDPGDGGRGSRYRRLRHDIGRGILLGLEFMVAGDIIRTVAVEPTLQSLAVLGGIVLVRTFLSLSLEVELEGRWPWRNADAEAAANRR